MKHLEDFLQVECVQELNNHRDTVFAFHVKNEGKKNIQVAMRDKALGLRSGVPDLCLVCCDGKTRWVELKAPLGVLSEHQKRFYDLCTKWGFDWALIRTIEEFREQLKKWGL